MAIVVKGYSDYGRKELTKYVIVEPYAAMLKAGEFDKFRANCGTHSVVASHNDAMLALVIHVSDVSNQSKQSLEAVYKNSVNASGTIKAVNLSGSIEKKVSWKSVVAAAHKMGSVNTRFVSRGGRGINDALKTVAVPDPQNLNAIVTVLTTIGTSFSQTNSAPVKFLLISNSALGDPVNVSDPAKLEVLNGYYLQLARVDYALSRVDGYRATFPALHAAVYARSPQVLALRAYRRQVVDAIEACVFNDACIYKPPADLGLLFAEDILLPESLTFNCGYKRYDSGDGTVSVNVLNDVSVVLRGKARLTKFVELQGAMIERIGPESVPPRRMPTTWQAMSLSQDEAADGTVRLIAQLDSQAFRSDVEISLGAVVLKNESELEVLRAEMLASIYTVKMQAQNGLTIRNTVGPPFAADCPVKKKVQK